MSAEAICAIDGCHKPARSARTGSLCNMHRQRMSRKGDATGVTRIWRKGGRSLPCSVPGCESLSNGGGICQKHRDRLRRLGSYDLPAPSQRWRRHHKPTVKTNPGGYQTTQQPGHPLAQKTGKVFVHQLVLFEKVGLGPHRCAWCDTHVNWRSGLECDHVDFVRSNNTPSNLVPACHRCNSTRPRP